MTKKTFTKLLSMMLVMLVALGAVTTAMAAPDKPEVTFDVNTEEFTFNMESYDPARWDYPDLFPSMKGMMPGDTVTETITIQVENVGTKSVRIYLTAENQNGDYDTLLAEGATLTATVTPITDSPANLSELFTALHNKLNGSEGAKENTYTDDNGMLLLGTYSAGETKQTVEMELSIPVTAGNALNGAEPMIDWVFIAEVFEETEITVTKVWDDQNDKDKIRPDHVDVTLKADGVAIGTASLDEAGEWKHTFDKLAKFGDDKHEIVYTVEEAAVEGYEATIDGFVITNKHVPEETPPTPPTPPDDGDDEPTPTPPTPPTPPDEPPVTPPGEDIGEPDVPLAPGTPDEPGEVIDEPDVPLGNLPQTGAEWARTIAVAGAGIALIAAALLLRKKEKKDK